MSAVASEGVKIKNKLQEAETYYSMGMINDSLVIYDQILATGAAIDPEELARIRERANQLKNEILNNNAKPSPSLSEGDLYLIKKSIFSIMGKQIILYIDMHY